MQFQVEVGENTHTVVVQREGERFTVTVSGRVHLIDAKRLNGQMLSLLVAPSPDAETVQSVEAAIAPGRQVGSFTVNVNGQDVPIQIRAGGAGRRKDAAATGSGPQRVVAPMPGKVVRVLVKAGDEVKPKQGLVVVEAMKMENELKSARAGRVRDVLVSEGRSVDAGTVLLIVE